MPSFLTPFRNRRRSARAPRLRSLLAGLVAGMLLPSALAALGLSWWGYRSEVQKVEAATLAASRALAASVDRYYLQLAAALDALGNSPSLASGDLHAFQSQAAAFLRSSGLAMNVFLIRPDGSFAANTVLPLRDALPASVDPTHPEHAAFKAALEGQAPVISNLYYGTLARQNLIAVGIRVHAPGAGPLVIAGGVPVGTLGNLIADAHLQPGWVAGLLDRSHVIAARWPTEAGLIGQPVGSDLREHVERAAEGMVRTTTKDGVRVLAFHSKAPASGYTAVIGVPEEALIAPLRERLLLAAASLAAVLALSLLLAYDLTRRITSAMQLLAREAKVVWRGRGAGIRRLAFQEADDVRIALNIAAAELQEMRSELNDVQRGQDVFGPAALEGVLDATDDAILLLDHELKVFHCNSVAEALLGRPIDRLAGCALTALVRSRSTLEAMLQERCPAVALDADGHAVPVTCRVSGRYAGNREVFAASIRRLK